MDSPKKILIVEDDESQRALYSEELREEGYREDFMSRAADAYLTKSSDLTELKKVVRDLLNKRKKPLTPHQIS